MLISLERVCVKKVKQPDGGDIAEFGKKRNTDYDFPLHYMWAENYNKTVCNGTH